MKHCRVCHQEGLVIYDLCQRCAPDIHRKHAKEMAAVAELSDEYREETGRNPLKDFAAFEQWCNDKVEREKQKWDRPIEIGDYVRRKGVYIFTAGEVKEVKVDGKKRLFVEWPSGAIQFITEEELQRDFTLDKDMPHYKATTTITFPCRVKCPQCGQKQKAEVTRQEGDPFPIYFHECENCGYVIMESEWEEVHA